MHILRRMALAVVSPLFIILLFATAFDVGFIKVATNSGNVKKLVAESGVYNSVIPSVLQQQKSFTTNYGNVSTNDPAVERAAKVAVSPQYIQQNTELAIDNIYDWLNGKIAQPNFKINLTDAKTLFANNIADTLQKRLAKLPACSLAQSRAILQSGQYDAFNATCVPSGASVPVIAEQVKSAIVNNQDFLGDTSINAANIKNDGSSQSVFNDQLKNAPKQYQRAKKTPAILILLTVLTGIAIVFLSASWQKGLRHIGLNLLIVGVLMLVFSWALNRAISKNIAPKIKVDNAILQQDVRNLVTDLGQQVDKNYWIFGGIYAVVGAAAWTAGQAYHRRSQAVLVKDTPAAEEADSQTPRPKTKPKTKKPAK